MKYQVNVLSWSTGDCLYSLVFDHYPCREAWDIELSDYNKKCVIINL